MNLSLLYKFDNILSKPGYWLLKIFQKKRDFHIPEKLKHILVIKFLGGGSLTLAAPALLALKEKYPDAEISILTTSGIKDNAMLLNIFDRIEIFSVSKIFRTAGLLMKLKRHLKENSLIIDLELYSRFSHVLSSYLRGSCVIGLKRPGEKCLWDHALVATENVPMYQLYNTLSIVAGATIESHAIQKFFAASSREKRLTVAPFCSTLSLKRKWDNTKWSEFINSFLSAHPLYSAVIIGTSADHLEGENILNLLPDEIRNRCKNLCGQINFQSAFEIIRSSSLFAGIDSAPLHLARLTGVPAISLWGATSASHLTREFPDYPEVQLSIVMPCSPCVHKDGQSCPFSTGCTALIPCTTVIKLADELLSGKITSCYIHTIQKKEYLP